MAERNTLADIVEQIATEPVFDEEKYVRFNRLLDGFAEKTNAVAQAADESTEFYVIWVHEGARFRSDPRQAEAMLRDDRERLLELAGAIRRGE